MIERANVHGKPATVAYMDADFNPVVKLDATLVKVIFDDGEVVIASLKKHEASQ